MIILLIILLHHFASGYAKHAAENEMTTLPIETSFATNPETENALEISGLPAKFPEVSSFWELRKHDDVFIYQRWVEAEPDRKARELYAEIQVKSNPEQLAQIIRNEKYGTEWLSMADEYKVSKKNSDLEWYAYSKFDFLPALRFDLVTRNEMIRRSFIHIKRAFPDMFPYVDNPSIPMTTNALDSFFGHLKENISIHRRLSMEL